MKSQNKYFTCVRRQRSDTKEKISYLATTELIEQQGRATKGAQQQRITPNNSNEKYLATSKGIRVARNNQEHIETRESIKQ